MTYYPKKWRLWVILVKKKYCMKIISCYLILTHHKNQALRFFHFSWRKWEQFLFLHNTQKSAVSRAYTLFPLISKKTNDIDISVTGTDYWNSKLSKKNDLDSLFSIFQKNLHESTVQTSYFGRISRLL